MHQIPFLPPAVRDPTAKGVIRTRLVVLDVDQTTKVRAIAKSHDRTVIQLVDSVFAVSHVEAALTNAKARGEERFNTVADLYEIATNWLIPLAFKDQVSLKLSFLRASDLTAVASVLLWQDIHHSSRRRAQRCSLSTVIVFSLT